MSDALGRRLSRAIVAIGLTGAAYYWVLGGAYTIRDMEDLDRRVSEQAAEVEAMHAEWDRIRSRADSLESDPWLIERVARERYSFIRPGETLFRFVELEEADADSRPPSDE